MNHVEKLDAVDNQGVSISKNNALQEGGGAEGFYTVTCFDKDGNLKWKEEMHNLVVTTGKNLILNTVFTGSSYTAAWYMGLVEGATTPTYALTDTMASHPGWTESTSYSAATRPAPSWGTSTADSISTTATAFSINATDTIAGAFMTTNSTKGGTTGTLYSAGNFTAGSRSVQNGDTLNVTWTGTV